jgi:hypothetical protein
VRADSVKEMVGTRGFEPLTLPCQLSVGPELTLTRAAKADKSALASILPHFLLGPLAIA